MPRHPMLRGRNPAIWVMDADGSNQRKIIDHGIDPIWSFDDRKIAYASNHEGEIFHISLANSDGTDVHRIPKRKGKIRIRFGRQTVLPSHLLQKLKETAADYS
ncbi:MAG: hypothetical protein NVS9B5_20280 [Terriglobales bacterium]